MRCVSLSGVDFVVCPCKINEYTKIHAYTHTTNLVSSTKKQIIFYTGKVGKEEEVI